ncbi:MAG: ABC transporter permease [Tenuifilaceae bacterium]|jgi:putative ABC transport system permease protein|nr:ABC transporter permease [Tenuifilaceae bacterium]
MILHSFKLFWNQKRKFTYILIEVFALYVMLVLCFAYIGQMFYRYSQKAGYDWHNVVSLGFEKIETGADTLDFNQEYSIEANVGVAQNQQETDVPSLIEQQLMAIKGVQGVTRVIEATPYFLSMWSLTLKYNDIHSTAVIHIADANYQSVMNYQMLAGQWYTASMEKEVMPPMVIDRLLAEKFFGSPEVALGKEIVFEERNFKICGVYADYKRMENEDVWPSFFIPISAYTRAENHMLSYLIRFQNNENYPFKEIERAVNSVIDPQRWEIASLNSLEAMRQELINKQRVELITVVFVGAVLLITALLGIIGIFSYTINRRKAEIGLRRATGATLSSIWKQLLTEMLVISVIAIIPAMLILIQIPIFGEFNESASITFIFSIFTVAIVLIVMILAAVFYPAYKASRVEPALALKDE